MSLAEIRFIQKRLEEKYAEVGKIAGKYVEAGYTVSVKQTKTRRGVIDIVARKGETYAIDVYKKTGPVPVSIIEEIAEKAKAINAKPVLALWGRGPKVTEEVLKKAGELGVKIKRFSD